MSSQIFPKKIDKADPSEMPYALKTEWSNGESYVIPYAELRFNCPCANCVDEHSGVRTIKRDSIPKDIRPKGLQLVGRYAVQITWSDDHSTGMYHYDALYKLSQAHGKKL